MQPCKFPAAILLPEGSTERETTPGRTAALTKDNGRAENKRERWVHNGAWRNSCSANCNLFKGSQTWVDGDSYVGAWSAGLRSGWGATYWNNGNMHEGNNAADGGVMHGQALHFKWGDGAAFRSESESLSSVTTGRALRIQPELSRELFCHFRFNPVSSP